MECCFRVDGRFLFRFGLYTGNGTQRVVQNVNEQHGQDKSLSMYFGSVHDIEKYPCDVRLQHAFPVISSRRFPDSNTFLLPILCPR